MSVADRLREAETTGALALQGYHLQLFPAVEGYSLEDVVEIGGPLSSPLCSFFHLGTISPLCHYLFGIQRWCVNDAPQLGSDHAYDTSVRGARLMHGVGAVQRRTRSPFRGLARENAMQQVVRKVLSETFCETLSSVTDHIGVYLIFEWRLQSSNSKTEGQSKQQTATVPGP